LGKGSVGLLTVKLRQRGFKNLQASQKLQRVGG
jgi:hypothetical protein